ncbi:MAG TPA: DUF952 domain-containing protein [Bauldia sp.]|nr:DUF952 domain-containing protein [Bauldia sp.]
MAMIFKICPAALWREAVAAGVFRGSPVDLADGFIHFSTAAQVAETAAKHFAGQNDLVLAAFNDGAIGDVRYEPSRGGQLFPHLYGTLDPKLALWVRPVTTRPDGTHALPALT